VLLLVPLQFFWLSSVRGDKPARVDQNSLKAFGKEIRLSLRRAILPIRDAEPKEPAKGAQMKTTVLQCFLSFPSQADSNFVIGFFHKIYFPSAYRLIAERQINLATSTRDCDCFCKDPKKRTAVCCAPQRYSSFFIVMEERQYLLCW
jgi:hypothetical protein